LRGRGKYKLMERREDEEDVSTFEDQTSSGSWFPEADVHQGGKEDPKPETSQKEIPVVGFRLTCNPSTKRSPK
jgi:hypothetical protein